MWVSLGSDSVLKLPLVFLFSSKTCGVRRHLKAHSGLYGPNLSPASWPDDLQPPTDLHPLTTSFVLPWCSVTSWRAFVWGFCSNICTLCMKRAAVQSHSVVRSGCDLVWILNPAQITKSLKTSQFYRHKFSRGQQLPSDSFKIRFDAGDNTSRLLMKPCRYLPSYILKQERVKLDFKLQKKKISQLMQLHTEMM